MQIPGFSILIVGRVMAALPFSPLRLILLVLWIYLCLYLVQVLQFSPLVSKRFRPAACLVTLFTGPVLLPHYSFM